MDAFDVHDLVARVAWAVHGAGVLCGVEHRPDPAVPGRVRERLEAAPLELGDHLGERLGWIEGIPASFRPVRVRLEHRCGMWLDHVVDVELDRADPEPVVVVGAFRLRERVEVVGGRLGRVEEGREDAGAHHTLRPRLHEERQVVDRVLRVDRRRDPELGGHVEAPQELPVGGVRTEVRNLGRERRLTVLRQPHHGEVGDEARRLAPFVPLDETERDVSGARTDAESTHRLAVQPGVVDVVGEDHHGAAGSDAVQVAGARPAAVRQRRVVPGLADDPVVVGMGRRIRVDRRPNLVERRRRPELHGVGVRPEPEVVVRVDEAGEDRVPEGIDLFGRRRHSFPDRTVVTDGDDPTVPDADGFGDRVRRVDRPDLRVPDQEVHRARS